MERFRKRENPLEVSYHMHNLRTGSKSASTVRTQSTVVTPKESEKGGYKKPSDLD